MKLRRGLRHDPLYNVDDTLSADNSGVARGGVDGVKPPHGLSKKIFSPCNLNNSSFSSNDSRCLL